MKNKTLLTFIAAFVASIIQINAQCSPNWLSTKGNKLVDSNNSEVILAGVNWSGFEASIGVLEGLYARDMYSALEQIKDLGFNCVRIPWANSILRDGATYQAANYWVKDSYGYDGTPEAGPYSNLDLQDITKPIEVMDLIVNWCQENDMKIILDCHSREPNGYLTEKTWFTNITSEEQWIEDWVFMANRYKDNSAVIGMDINNEPNGKIDNPVGARWGTGGKYDWKLAAEKCGNAILEVNPNVLILVEGIEAYNKPNGDTTSYWWGGNLQGVREHPIQLSIPEKLMYSPHEYGPTVFNQTWFSAPDFPNNMRDIWEEQFNFIHTQEISPLLIGELGIKEEGGKDEQWFKEFINFIKEKKLHFTFWTFNPNSGDTGGILGLNGPSDFDNVVQWKMDYLKPILSQPIPNCTEKSVLSIIDFEKEVNPSFTITPNPSNGAIYINNSNSKINSISIYTLTGKTIYTLNNVNSKEVNIDITNFAKGVYIVKVESLQKTIQTLKLIRN